MSKVEFKKGKTIEITDLPAGWEDTVMTEMSEGAHKLEVHLQIGVTRQQHLTLIKKNEDYAWAFELGKDLAEAWWLMKGRKGVTDKTFNTGFYAFCMKNRFNWKDAPTKEKGEDGVPDDGYKDAEIIGKFTEGGKNDLNSINKH